ncbi:unnamed protein product [Alternaria burnsii]|nr:unnamed protein product [Alternaria burnsii]
MHFKALKIGVALFSGLIPSMMCQEGNSSMPVFTPELNSMRTLSVGFVIFPGFELLDVFGPMEILTVLSAFNKMTLSVIAEETGLVPAGMQPYGPDDFSAPPTDFGHVIAPRVEATHNFKNAPALDILFVPGGLGVVTLEQTNNTGVEDFVKLRYASLEYLIGVSFGGTTLARAGVLDGKRATTNKSGWTWITERGPNVTWVPQARWVEDGNIWTTSGTASGLDATYALFSRLYGAQPLNYMLNVIEYAPHLDPSWDPYATAFNVSKSNNSTWQSCVNPVTMPMR